MKNKVIRNEGVHDKRREIMSKTNMKLQREKQKVGEEM